MIKPNTILMVGAGASVPFGLPSGAELLSASQQAKDAAEFNLMMQRFLKVQADQDALMHWTEVIEYIHAADLYSIDTFLEKHKINHWFQLVGKALIAYSLFDHIKELRLTSLPNMKRGVTDWIKFVWNQMNAGTESFEDFKRNNNLSFITFNFDPLIERKLCRGIRHLYADAQPEEIETYVDSIVIHVHGRLNAPTAREGVFDQILLFIATTPGRRCLTVSRKREEAEPSDR